MTAALAEPPHRPALRYLGGKWQLAPWILSLMPPHRTYVEPFGGGAAVLLRKPRSLIEVYNDLDGDLVNLFRVLRNETGPGHAELLCQAIQLTLFARSEFEAAYEPTSEPVERARRLIVRSYMGHGSNSTNAARTTGFRIGTTRRGAAPARDWAHLPPALAAVAARIQGQGVTVENRPAVDLIQRLDASDTLVYADPPYLHSTRSSKTVRGALYNAYPHEMTDDQHVELLEVLLRCKGMVLLSGYPNALYAERLGGWRRVERAHFADGARARTEVVWMNEPAVRAGGLFSLGAHR